VTVNNRLQLVEQLKEEVYDSLDVFTFLAETLTAQIMRWFCVHPLYI